MNVIMIEIPDVTMHFYYSYSRLKPKNVRIPTHTATQDISRERQREICREGEGATEI